MKPLEKLYWLRFFLGIVAALLCVGYGVVTNTISKEYDITVLMNGISFALIIYMLSYYIIRPKFIMKIEKPQKILTTGIGIYIFSWIVFWALLYTILLSG